MSELRFGFIDAERYLRNPDDPLSELFRKSFYKSTHLERAVNPDIYFLLGEKGTGKTAYAVYASLYMKNEYRADCEFFDKNDFTRFVQVADKLGVEKSQYSSMWVFIFMILLIQKLENTLPIKGELEHVINSIKAINLGGDADNISRCIETASEIDALFNLFAQSSNLNVPKHVLTGAKPSFKLNRLTEICVKALAQHSSDLQFTLFIDGLDVRPDEVSYPDYLTVVSSICNAIWVLSATQLARIPPSLKVVILLRPDIFEAVPFQNRGPKLQNHAHLVEWSARYKDYQDSEIFKFTDRILYSQQETGERLREGDTWRHYFPFRIESRVSDGGDDPFILFLRHSFYKPRDIIKYLSLMREFYAEPGKGKDQRLHFSKDVFEDRDIRKEYSSYLMQEIRDQLSFYYTNNEYQQFLDFNNGFLGKYVDRYSRIFAYDDFEKAHHDYLEYNKKNHIATLPSFATADIALQFMFDLNVLGYYEEKTFRNGEKRIFTNYSFRQRSFANLRPKVPSGGRYVMHYGVAKSLFVELG
ncbi:MAG: hypothetical protein ABSC37_21785 [Xanthobacteraceae bacterium]